MRRILPGVLLLLLATATGCGAADAASDAAGDAIDSVQVGGDWSGTWKNQSGQGGVTSMHLEQHGLSVTGSIRFGSNSCLSEATVHGWVDREGIHGTLDAGEAHLTFEAGLDGTDVNGVYESLVTGPCEGERGTVWFMK